MLKSNDKQALIASAGNGHLSIVTYLVEEKECTAINEALIASAGNGHLDVSIYLVEQGANVHARCGSALRKSIIGDHYDIVVFLVEQGVNINNDKFKHNKGSLLLSANYNHPRIVKFLLTFYSEDVVTNIIKRDNLGILLNFINKNNKDEYPLLLLGFRNAFIEIKD